MRFSHARWALALAEDVRATPYPTFLEARPVVLWRDTAGRVHGLRDRCPHRGIPLSAGQVAPDGRLACRDHGWRFDGVSGRLVHVPGADQKLPFPAQFHAVPVAVVEQAGFVWTGPPPPPADRLPLFGATHVALDHAAYVAGLLDGPGLLLGFHHVRAGAEPAGEPRLEDGVVRVDWPARGVGPWRGLKQFVWGQETRLGSGETFISLRRGGRVLVAARIAPAPAPRGTTIIRWRATAGPFGIGFGLRRFEGAALAALAPTVSGALEPPVAGSSF